MALAGRLSLLSISSQCAKHILKPFIPNETTVIQKKVGINLIWTLDW